MSIFSRLFNRKPLFQIRMHPTAKLTGSGRIVPAATLPGYPEKEMSIVYIGAGATLHVDGEFSVRGGCRITVMEGATLELGDGFMFRNCKILCSEHIKIGKAAIISDGAEIIDGIGEPILIGEAVSIGKNVTIHRGSVIKDLTSVGRGSVVTQNVIRRSAVEREADALDALGVALPR